MAETKPIHMVAELSLIHTLARWRLPGSWDGYNPYGSPDLYLDLARLLEHGKFDAAFFADVAGTPLFHGTTDATVEWGVAWPRHDPLPLAIAMAGVTKHLGFITTMSMTYHHPFNVARLYASIDHVTRGRIAYNAVVSGFPQEAQNFGYETTPDHDWRYRRAEEFLTVLDKLWNSIDSDAMLWDRDSGRVADPTKVRRIDHEGEHFKVMGPLPVSPMPQGRPIQIQAGQSEAGIRLAAQWADAQFAVRDDHAGMAAHRARMDAAIAASPNPNRSVSLLWGNGAFDVVASPEEAQANLRRRVEATPPMMTLVFLSQWWGIDGYKLDPSRGVRDTIQEIKESGVGPNWGYLEEALRITDDKTTIGEYARSRVGKAADFCGTPEQIADQMEAAHEAAGGNGGWMLWPVTGIMSGFSRFVHEVVPVLQHRGLVHKKYPGTTMRENLLNG